MSTASYNIMNNNHRTILHDYQTYRAVTTPSRYVSLGIFGAELTFRDN